MLPFPTFDFTAPRTVPEAIDHLARPGAMALAGGTDLLPSVKHRLFRPAIIVSLGGLTDLRGITETSDGIRIGALTTLREVASSPLVSSRWPALAAACRTVATPTIQAMATLGGNVLLDTRCVYYNQPEGWRAAQGGCLKCDGTVCHVAPRGKGCYAAHSADTVPALWLYGASVEVVSAAGTRHIAIHDLYHDDGMRWLRIAPGELLTHVFVPHRAARVVHHKSRTRAAIDYGWLLAAVERDAHRFRAVISAVGPAPVEVTGESPEALAEAAYTAVQPLSTHLTPAPYRKRMVRVAVLRAARSLT